MARNEPLTGRLREWPKGVAERGRSGGTGASRRPGGAPGAAGPRTGVCSRYMWPCAWLCALFRYGTAALAWDAWVGPRLRQAALTGQDGPQGFRCHNPRGWRTGPGGWDMLPGPSPRRHKAAGKRQFGICRASGGHPPGIREASVKRPSGGPPASVSRRTARSALASAARGRRRTARPRTVHRRPFRSLRPNHRPPCGSRLAPFARVPPDPDARAYQLRHVPRTLARIRRFGWSPFCAFSACLA